MPRRILTALALVTAAALTLAGCASTSDAPPGQQQDIEAAWLDDGRLIGIVTSGSSTCVPVAQSADVDAEGVLQVTMAPADTGTACTKDLVPRVTLVTTPDGVDPSQPLEIWVTDEGYYGNVTLGGATSLAGPGGDTDYQPSAGWTQQQGQFVILTWGSSGCPAVVQSSQVTGPAEVTVVFQDPPASQACTMDMSPRTAFGFADGLEGTPNVQLVLTGDSFDSTVTIAGSNP